MVRSAGKNKPTKEGSTKVNFYSCAMAATEKDMDFLLKLRKLKRRETSSSISYLSAENTMKKKEKLRIRTLIKMD